MLKQGILSWILLIAIQGVSQSDYSNDYLGWIRMIKPADPVKATRYDHRSFSAAQLTTCNLFISWIQASYTPKGGLGEGRKTANEKLSPYNQYTRSLHDYYGATLPTYLFLKKKTGGGWTPENNLGHFLRIIANGPVGDHVDLICSPEQYYFYIPDIDPDNTYDKAYARFMSFDHHPAINRYIHFYQPKTIRFQSQYTIVLSKEQQRPWIQITKGEFLDQLEKTVERTHIENLEKINRDFNEKRKQDFTKDEETLYKKRKTILAQQVEKYRYRRNEKATIYTEQPSVFLENTADIFEGNGASNRKIPVYKYDPSLAAGLKSGIPQWVTIAWGDGNMDQESFKNLHASMLNNVDYSFIYNYFFDTEKTKGFSYKPLSPPVIKEEMVAIRESTISEQKKAIPGTVFYEDFSNTAPGNTPVNWKSTNNFNGEKVKTEQRSKKDNWAVLNGQQLELRAPLLFPANFSFSCALAVPKGFTWGAKRLVIRFGNSKESFEVSMRPGFDGRPGFLYAGENEPGSVILQPGSLNKATEIPMPGFSNNNTFNEIQLEVSKKGTALELRIDGKTVFNQPLAFTTAGIKIQGLNFSHSRSDAEQEKYYISNLLIRKID